MKRVGYLMDKIADLDNLYLAFYKASRGKEHKASVISYARDLDRNVGELHQQLLRGQVEVGNYHYFKIFDPKERLICAAAFPERVVHHAIMNVCHPYFDRTLIGDTYATRLGKGIYAALDKGQKAMIQYGYVGKLDFRHYFDSIDHKLLKVKLHRLFKDASLLHLLESIVDSYSVEEERGIPIGNLTSQYFANLYLSELDHYVKETLQVPVYLRYMDDMLLFGQSKGDVLEYISRVRDFARESGGDSLVLKTPIVNASASGIEFLGYRLYPHHVGLSERSKIRFRSKIVKYKQLMEQGVWPEQTYRAHLQPLLSFARYAYTKQFRMQVIYG